MTAPAPSPYEQEQIDRFGIFDEERVVEEVARAMFERPLGYGDRCAWREASEGIRDSFRADAAAAVAAYRATQDGGAEGAVRRVGDAVTQMDEHADTMDNTAEAWKRLNNQPDWARCAAVADALREHADRIRAALAPQADR